MTSPEPLYEIEVRVWVDHEAAGLSWSVGGKYPDKETALDLLMKGVSGIVLSLGTSDEHHTARWAAAGQDEAHPFDRREREPWRLEHGTTGVGFPLKEPLT